MGEEAETLVRMEDVVEVISKIVAEVLVVHEVAEVAGEAIKAEDGVENKTKEAGAAVSNVVDGEDSNSVVVLVDNEALATREEVPITAASPVLVASGEVKVTINKMQMLVDIRPSLRKI